MAYPKHIINVAETLYFEGWPLARILEHLQHQHPEMNSKTLSDWKKKYKWEDRLNTEEKARLNATQITWKLLNHCLKVLEAQVDEEVKRGEFKMISKGDIDAIAKLHASLKKSDPQWSEYVRMLTHFTEWLQSEDLDLAKQITAVGHRFLHQMRSGSAAV